MRGIWELTLGGFRRWSRYRVTMLTALLANTVFGLIRASLLVAAIEGAGGEVNGYDRLAAVTYVWIGQAMLGPVEIWGSHAHELGDRIKSGEFAIDALRPLHPLVQWWATNLGRMASQLLPRFVPMLVVGALTTGLALPTNPVLWGTFAVSMVLANALCLMLWLMVNLLAMWLTDIRGYRVFFMVVFNTLSGMLVPVQWFPDWLRTLVDAGPLPSMWQAPIDLITGVGSSQVPQLLLTQLGWVVVITLAAAGMLRLGMRRLEVQGG